MKLFQVVSGVKLPLTHTGWSKKFATKLLSLIDTIEQDDP